MKSYNILIYMLGGIDPTRGGIERISVLLAREFIARGSKVYSLSSVVDGDFGYTGSFAVPVPYRADRANTEYIDSLIEKLDIDILLATTLAHDTMYLNLRGLKSKVRIISHYHASPRGNHSRIHSLEKYPISSFRWFQNLAFEIQKRRVAPKYRGIGRMVDKIVMLSPAFIPELRLLGEFPDSQLKVIRNPLTYPATSFDLGSKEKTVLWVGRINDSEKRVSSLLRIWRYASDDMPGWKLKILGGGGELGKWKNRADALGLQRIEFLGFRDPKEYFHKASIYILTSNQEGWPTTLMEAMSHSCASIAFNSFASAPDMIMNGENGFLIKAFDDKAFAGKIVELSRNPELRERIARNAWEGTNEYSVDSICDDWYSLFEELDAK